MTHAEQKYHSFWAFTLIDYTPYCVNYLQRCFIKAGEGCQFVTYPSIGLIIGYVHLRRGRSQAEVRARFCFNPPPPDDTPSYTLPTCMHKHSAIITHPPDMDIAATVAHILSSVKEGLSELHTAFGHTEYQGPGSAHALSLAAARASSRRAKQLRKKALSQSARFFKKEVKLQQHAQVDWAPTQSQLSSHYSSATPKFTIPLDEREQIKAEEVEECVFQQQVARADQHLGSYPPAAQVYLEDTYPCMPLLLKNE